MVDQHRAPVSASVRSRGHRRARLWPAAVAVLVAVLAAVGLLAGERDEAGPATAAAGLPALEAEPGLVHVHGLGVDPSDGVLYAATHSGLFRLPEDGEPTRVANRAQDTMGFAVVGPRTFVGSGHPDFREDDVRPPLLGLIESTDAGQTWKRLSLHGEADFHALRVAHGRVYGYDATSATFMVTSDRRSWDRRAQLEMRDFAVSPTTPDVIVGTTPQGVLRSGDGGRTWQRPTGAPALVVVAWPGADRLYGVAQDGTVHRSVDAGASWTRSGSVGGEPAALSVDRVGGAEVLHVAVHRLGIVASRDGGASFTTRYREPGSG